MTRQQNPARREQEILTLLTYPKVGPLTREAIRINLGADETEVKEALGALLAEGRVVAADTTPVPHLRGDVAVPLDEERYTVLHRAGSERL